MRRAPVLLAALLTAAVPPLPAQVLAQRMRALLDEPPFDRATWGVAIADPRGRVVFERNGDRLFVPASSTKIVVAAVAAVLLGPQYRFRTSVYASGPIIDSTLQGDLVLYGRGDPTLSARFSAGRLAPFEELADSLRARGIARVAGDVVGDASWFEGASIHPEWETGDLIWAFAAPVTALGWNGNGSDVRITPGALGREPFVSLDPDLRHLQVRNRARTVDADSTRTLELRRWPGSDTLVIEGGLPADARARLETVSIPDGARWTAEAFRYALESRGIAVAGTVRAVYDSTATVDARRFPPLADRWSVPLAYVLQPILESSDNWTAEMLLRTLGRVRGGRGTWDAGVEVERRFLIDSLRVDSTLFALSDGSGLSHHDLIAPVAFVRILQAIRTHPSGAAFVDALPVGGRSGTLRNRFDGTRLEGRVRAKTGSIGNVNTLSGYLEGVRGTWTFSIQVNNHTAKSREAIARIDRIVAAIER